MSDLEWVDEHSPQGQAIVERWLIAFFSDKARPGDCMTLLDQAITVRVQVAVAAELEVAVNTARAFKGGDVKCEQCGCWNLVDTIADAIEHGDFSPPASAPEGENKNAD